ncbi:cytochrome b-245 light chain [Aplysia californica]|uniref:Cytochrome b-245 light chain n=1 Tax=Aplysia californica TaxID=6500 RepID=A0ABM0JM00_APLCA|nr:cytochrome b-245 light chain [Aplysia californica]
MGKIEWAMWANEQAIASSCVTALGGFIAAIGQFKNWQIGVYAIAAGVLTFALEYPRGKRQKGTSYERSFQRPLTIIVSQGRLLTRNYFVRFVLYLALSVPCCFVLPTLLGALCLMISGFIYLLAAVKGEEWHPVEAKKDEPGPKTIQEPKRPPPRRPETSGTPGAVESAQVNNRV